MPILDVIRAADEWWDALPENVKQAHIQAREIRRLREHNDGVCAEGCTYCAQLKKDGFIRER